MRPSLSPFVSLSPYQEIDLAQDILRREGPSLPTAHGELLPITVHPGSGCSLLVLGEGEEGRARRVFLTSSPNEELFWAVDSIRFVIDAGVQRRCVRSQDGSDTSSVLEIHVEVLCSSFDVDVFLVICNRYTTPGLGLTLLSYGQSVRAKQRVGGSWQVRLLKSRRRSILGID